MSLSLVGKVSLSLILFQVSWGFKFLPSAPQRLYSIQRSTQSSNTIGANSWLRMSDAAEAASSSDAKKKSGGGNFKKAVKDFSGFKVGQQIDGTVVGAKAFGVFVDISNGINVLLPRSVISRGTYEKLNRLFQTKSKESVKIELLAISSENQTISAKYINPYVSEVKDIATLGEDKESFAGKSFNATVVGVHDFGVFCEIDEFEAEGLVPATRLPNPLPSGTIQSSYTVGSTVQVEIEDINSAKKKLTLSMRGVRQSGGSGTGDSLDGFPPTKWVQGIVQSVVPFGLIVRPAGKDISGLVHSSKIPFGLLNALKKVSPLAEGLNKTEVEQLFSVGDVIRCRLNSYNAANNKLELAMTPYKASEDDEDDYVVEGRDPEGEEEQVVQQDDANEDVYDPEDTLLWWKGAPYKKIGSTEVEAKDEEADIILESTNIIEGTWRRMFEVDMREDAADFSSKLLETEIKELEEEIGELNGLDDELVDSEGFGTALNTKNFGSYISSQVVPEAWKSEVDFFNFFESTESDRKTKLKGGKKAEQDEFEKLLREVELELEQMAAKRGGGAPIAIQSQEIVEPAVQQVESVSTAPVEGA